jgi:hypothetical protein
LIAGSTIVIPPINLVGGAWISTDGSLTWTPAQGGPSLAGAVATNAKGTVLLAVPGMDDSGAGIWTSASSGATWTVPTSPAAFNGWSSVASDSTGTHLVAAAAFGDIWTSTDFGASWTDQTASGPAHSLNWVSIASSSDGSHLVAAQGGGFVVAGDGATGDIWTSSDSGVTWTDRTASGAPHNLSWSSVASDAAGTNLIAVGSGIWTSSDSGVTWTQQATDLIAYSWVSVASNSDGTQLIAASQTQIGGPGDLWTSYDSGVTWTNSTAGTPAAAQQWTAVAATQTEIGSFVAVAMRGDIWTMFR